jgi:hypothetical protein
MIFFLFFWTLNSAWSAQFTDRSMWAGFTRPCNQQPSHKARK